MPPEVSAKSWLHIYIFLNAFARSQLDHVAPDICVTCTEHLQGLFLPPSHSFSKPEISFPSVYFWTAHTCELIPGSKQLRIDDGILSLFAALYLLVKTSNLKFYLIMVAFLILSINARSSLEQNCKWVFIVKPLKVLLHLLMLWSHVVTLLQLLDGRACRTLFGSFDCQPCKFLKPYQVMIWN